MAAAQRAEMCKRQALVHPQPQHGGRGKGPSSVRELTAYQAEGGGGGTTCGRSLQVIVFGSSHGASQGPVVPPPVLPPRSVTENSEPADVKWKEPQLLMPTWYDGNVPAKVPTLRATTFWNVAFPAERALSTDVPVPSTWMSWKWTFVME